MGLGRLLRHLLGDDTAVPAASGVRSTPPPRAAALPRLSAHKQSQTVLNYIPTRYSLNSVPSQHAGQAANRKN